MAWASLFSALFLGLTMVVESDPYLPADSYTWYVLLGVAFVVQALGWYAISSSLPKLKASQSGMILLLQPTLATVWGAIFFAEQLQLLQIVGAALTIAAIYFGSVRNNNKKAKLPK